MAKILILDDDFELASAWRSALTAAGHSATLSHSTPDALQHMHTNRFDAAVVDLMISVPPGEPPDSGIHFLRAIKQTAPLPRLIGVSGYYASDKGEMAETVLRVYGVEHVLFKPFEPDQLVALI